jgi:hypothetical protein
MTDDILRERDERGHHIVPYPAQQAQAGATALREAAKLVFDKFVRDEADGYRSRDRQFAIDILGRVLTALPPAAAPAKEKA